MLTFASALCHADHQDVLCFTEEEKGFILIFEIFLDLEFGIPLCCKDRSKMEYEYGTGSRHPSH